jgi:steroid 5-alpha reductase family enzyme
LSTLGFINLHKMLVIPVVLAMMLYFDNWSTDAFIYLALHGTYSILWLIKQRTFTDQRFAQQIPPMWAGWLMIFLPLAGYYIAPYLLVSRYIVLAPWALALAISMYIVGVFLHYVSDAQKFYTLRLRKGLIDDGLFTYTRNPNYLGEMLIYTSFGVLAWHWMPFAVLAGWSIFFFKNMLRKDRSLERHPDFQAYKKRSRLLL